MIGSHVTTDHRYKHRAGRGSIPGRKGNKMMTVQFLTKMLVPEVNVVVRAPLYKKNGRTAYMVCDENSAGEFANGNCKLYQSKVTNFRFKKDKFIITIDDV